MTNMVDLGNIVGGGLILGMLQLGYQAVKDWRSGASRAGRAQADKAVLEAVTAQEAAPDARFERMQKHQEWYDAQLRSMETRVDELNAENAALRTEAQAARSEAQAARDEAQACRQENASLRADIEAMRNERT